MFQTLQLKTSSLPSSRRIWAKLLASELRQGLVPDAATVILKAGVALVVVPSVTLMLTFEYTPTFAVVSTPLDRSPVEESKCAQAGL